MSGIARRMKFEYWRYRRLSAPDRALAGCAVPEYVSNSRPEQASAKRSDYVPAISNQPGNAAELLAHRVVFP